MTSSFARADKFIHKTNELPIENQTNNVKALSLALDKRVEVTEVNKNEQLSAMSSLVVPAAHAAQVFAPVVTNKNPAEIQKTNSLDISKQSTLTPNYASSFADGVTSFEGMSNVYKGESSEVSNDMSAHIQDDLMAPIYKAIRDILANPTTYEVIGAASSIVLMVKTLVTPAMTTVLNSVPVHSPSRAPIRVPTQSSSFINNQSNMRTARRA
jgi:hypothetical protein